MFFYQKSKEEESGENSWIRKLCRSLPEGEEKCFQTREQGGVEEEEERGEGWLQCQAQCPRPGHEQLQAGGSDEDDGDTGPGPGPGWVQGSVCPSSPFSSLHIFICMCLENFYLNTLDILNTEHFPTAG